MSSAFDILATIFGMGCGGCYAAALRPVKHVYCLYEKTASVFRGMPFRLLAKRSYFTTLSITRLKFLLPGLTACTLPSRSPGWGIALPDLDTRATTTT